MPTLGSENGGGGAGAADGTAEEELNNFKLWCDEDIPLGIADVIRPELQSNYGRDGNSSKDKLGSEGKEGFRSGYYRSRMFVNQNSKHKQSSQDNGHVTSLDVTVGGTCSSWDVPLMGNSPKTFITDTDFLMSLRPEKVSKNTDATECAHFVVHTNCQCTPDCVIGVCTNCYIVFCNIDCLNAGISGGNSTISSSSKSQLESFGGGNYKNTSVGRVLPKKNISTVHPGFITKTSTESSGPATACSFDGGVESNNNSGRPLKPFTPPGNQHSSSLNGFSSDCKQLISTYKTPTRQLDIDHKTPPCRNYDKKKFTGLESHSYDSQKISTLSPAVVKPAQKPVAGIFRPASGYQTSFQELPKRSFTTRPLDEFELGGKGHFENIENEPSKSGPSAGKVTIDSSDNYEFFGSPRGRGKDKNRESARPFMPGYPRPPEPARRYGDSPGAPEKISRDRPDLSKNYFRTEYNGIQDKVLRDPQNQNNFDLAKEPPVFRGSRGRGIRTRPVRDDAVYAARVDGNVQVRLTKPLRGVNDKRSSELDLKEVKEVIVIEGAMELERDLKTYLKIEATETEIERNPRGWKCDVFRKRTPISDDDDYDITTMGKYD